MNNFSNADTQNSLDEFAEVLDKCRECDCISTLKSFIKRSDGEFNHMDLQQNVSINVTSTVLINDKFIYVTLNSSNMADLRQIKEMWQTVLQRGTKKALAGKANDYVLVIDLVKQELEKNLVYTLSFMQPVFISTDGDSVILVFEMDNMFFGKDTVTLDEIEYEEELDRDRYEESNFESEYSETDEYIGTDEYIS